MLQRKSCTTMTFSIFRVENEASNEIHEQSETSGSEEIEEEEEEEEEVSDVSSEDVEPLKKPSPAASSLKNRENVASEKRKRVCKNNHEVRVTDCQAKKSRNDDDSELSESEEEDLDSELAHLDRSNIITGGGRRTRGKKIDFKSIVNNYGSDSEDDE